MIFDATTSYCTCILRNYSKLLLIVGNTYPASSENASQRIITWRELPTRPCWRIFFRVPSSNDFFEETFSKLWSSIHQKFPNLTKKGDQDTVYTIARRFYKENLQLRYRSHGRRPRPHYPTYQQLMTATYRGWLGHYLNSESDFQFLKKMQTENRIIPVIGDLGGSKALNKIGSYLTQKGLSISAFYVSNVEFYLIRGGEFSDFQRNLSALPISSNSLIVRSYFNYRREHPETLPGYCHHPDTENRELPEAQQKTTLSRLLGRSDTGLPADRKTVRKTGPASTTLTRVIQNPG